MARQVGGVRTAPQTNKMVIIPGSMAMSNGLTFTIGQITWTTGSDDFIAMTTEEARIQSASTTASSASATAPTMVDLAPATPALSSATPITRRRLPRYKGRQIDNSDLLDSINRVGTKLAETLALVSSIQSQPNEHVTATHNRSTRLAWVSHPTRLGTDLVVTSTPEGRSVHGRPALAMGLWLSEYEASMENHRRDNRDNRRDNRGRRANPDGNRDRRDGNNDLRHYLGGRNLRARINQRADD